MSKKVRIGYLVNFFEPAGVETYVLNLITKLDKTKFDPYLYVVYRANPDYVKRVEGHATVRYLRRFGGYSAYFFGKLVRALRQDHIDILHVNNWGTFLEGVVPKMMLKQLKVIFVQHGLEYKSYLHAPAAKKVLRRKLYRFGLPRVDSIVSVSHVGRRFLQDEFGANGVQVIHNGIDLARFSHETQLRRADIGLDDKDFVICSVGRIVGVKNYMCLVQGIHHLRQRGLDVKFLHIGQPTSRKDKNQELILDFIEREKLHRQIIFLGKRNDIHQILPLCDAFALTSLSEGISLSLLEAQACSLPAVATNVGGNPEIVRDGVNGLLVPSNDAVAVADAIECLYRDDALRHTMASAAREVVDEHFNLDKMVYQYESAYLSMLG